MTEAATLRSIAVHQKRLSRQCCPDEGRHDHAVGAALAGTRRVEETGYRGRHTKLVVKCERKHFIDSLRCGIGPALHLRRAHDSVITFMQRRGGISAVYLRRGRYDHSRSVPRARLQHTVGAPDVVLDDEARLVYGTLHTHSGCEMKYDIGFGDEVAHDTRVGDVGRDQSEILGLKGCDQIVTRAGGKIVYRNNLVVIG